MDEITNEVRRRTRARSPAAAARAPPSASASPASPWSASARLPPRRLDERRLVQRGREQREHRCSTGRSPRRPDRGWRRHGRAGMRCRHHVLAAGPRPDAHGHVLGEEQQLELPQRPGADRHEGRAAGGRDRERRHRGAVDDGDREHGAGTVQAITVTVTTPATWATTHQNQTSATALEDRLHRHDRRRIHRARAPARDQDPARPSTARVSDAARCCSSPWWRWSGWSSRSG